VERVRARARVLADHPGAVPSTAEERDLDARLTRWAATAALRRHAGSGARVDLRTVGLLVGSGGALRHATDPEGLLRTALREDRSFVLPQDPRVAVDADYVLAAAGLLAAEHPDAAYALLERFC
jgi:MutL protein